jgi:hypothetical protein
LVSISARADSFLLSAEGFIHPGLCSAARVHSCVKARPRRHARVSPFSRSAPQWLLSGSPTARRRSCLVFLICVQFDLDLSFSSCLRRLELGPPAGFISVAPSVSQSPPARFSLGSFSVLAGSHWLSSHSVLVHAVDLGQAFILSSCSPHAHLVYVPDFLLGSCF